MNLLQNHFPPNPFVSKISSGYSRRSFLSLLLYSSLGSALIKTGASPTSYEGKLTRSQIEERLKKHFQCSDPHLWAFLVDVYEKCLFGRMEPAKPPLKNPWLVPGGVYVGQWLWDTTFLTDLLAVLPEQRDFIRGIYENFWQFQERWNGAKPDYAHGMIANFIAPDDGPPGFTGKDWLRFPGYSQAPLLAWGIERVFRRNRDVELVNRSLAPLEAFHEWYWRERDLDDVGLVTVGAYEGELAHARYETYDNEVDLDTLKLIPHPKHKAGPSNGNWYGDIYIPANTSYLLLSEASLIRLAKETKNYKLALRRQERWEKGVEAMRKHMWDKESGCFLAVHREGMKKLLPATVGGFVPLCAEIPSEEQASRMSQVLRTKHWNTPVPIPSVDATASEYKSDGFWRGDVWPSTVFQVTSGLKHYGDSGLASEIANRLLENAFKVGVSEHYDTQSGKPLGVPNLGMSAVLLTLVLEGISSKHRIQIL